MKTNSIALLPQDGFCPSGGATSVDELAWIAWMKKKLGLVLVRDNRNFRPISIAGFKVDGYGVDVSGQTYVLEYNGCFFHGCNHPDCPTAQAMAKNTDEQAVEKRISQLILTKEKENRLKRVSNTPGHPFGNFIFISIWEHELKQQMDQDQEMKAFIKSYKKRLHRQPLSLRKSFAGGRTDAVMHHVEVEEGEEIGYADFTSLYPSANACSEEGEEYPVGYPLIARGVEVDDLLQNIEGPENLFGVVFCELLPPRNLRHAVIPLKANDKLLFPLCRTCAVQQNQEECDHSDEQRKLTAHIPTPEFKAALKAGYQLLRIFEAWHFPPEQRSKDLLRSFVMDHYVDKEFASGFPSGVETEEQKREYAGHCSRILGVPVDWSKFAKNIGKRALYKNICNNFWGFFAKREDADVHLFTDKFEDFVKVQTDSSRQITELSVMTDGEFIMLAHKPVKEEPGPKSSLLLATFTTSMARIRLFNVLAAHPDNIIYMDTDSVLYLKSKDQQGPETLGDFGKLKDEVEAAYPGQQAYIRRFTSTGPKSYAYEVCNGKGQVIDTALKMKGISLTWNALEKLNQEKMVKLLRGGGHLVVPQMQFKKNIKKQSVHTVNLLKKISFVSSKRRFIPNSSRLDTIPFGYNLANS